MSLQNLGDLGEAIGGLAVLVTLVYLAIQTRQNTKAVQAASFQQVVDSFAEVTLVLAQHPDIAAVIFKGQTAPESLTPLEEMRYGMFLTSFCRRAESMFFQSQQGTLQRETWLGIQDSIGRTLSGQWPTAWWERCHFSVG
jgi:hypothetical protein